MHRPIGRLLLLLAGLASTPRAAHAQSSIHLRAPDRVRLAEARRLTRELAGRLWPGWDGTPAPLLLVSDSMEFLVGHPRPSPGFRRLGYDSLLGSEVWTRARQFPPTLLATFPAVSGMPTIVVGTAERTAKSSTTWVLTLLHEHFHQWQYAQPDYYPGIRRLDLARGDSTGQWMLDYPFPYDSAAIQVAMRRLADALVGALAASPGTRADAVRSVVQARDALRAALSADDYRYFEFQLWQEGTARFIEYAAARAAARLPHPSAAFRHLPDYQPYGATADSMLHGIRRELEQLDLGQKRRVAFYPIGAAIALVLDRTRPGWQRKYAQRPFALAALLPTDR
ncbi:MAG TPA: hypothetical protein VMY76_04865 [Gemmatimonadales bacterium]|nr:hypothetical protein [Gemmatimonadales bacterium]